MREVFYNHFIWFVRSGDLQFWNDPWSHLGILRQYLSAIQWKAVENQHITVMQVYTNADQVRADLSLLPSSVKQVLQQNFHSAPYRGNVQTQDYSHSPIILLLYVDDMIITGDDPIAIQLIKDQLHKQFEMKDEGRLPYFLGLEVAYSPRGSIVSAQISELLARAALTDERTAPTPMELHSKLSPTDGEPLSNPTRYRQLVGALIYQTVSRPDIANAVHIVSQFVSAPRSVHYAAVLRILRYLRGTLSPSLFFPSTSTFVLILMLLGQASLYIYI